MKHSIAPAIQDHHFFIEIVLQDRHFLQIATLDYHFWRKNNNDNDIMQSDLWMRPSVESISYNKKDVEIVPQNGYFNPSWVRGVEGVQGHVYLKHQKSHMFNPSL